MPIRLDAPNAAPARARFRRALLAWYRLNRRNLPWREDRNPYRIWVSEVMLQQTRVGAAVEYYRRFLARFPTIEKLAAARESSVLAAWSGLGYYRRARLLHRAAKEVARQHGGIVPGSAAALRQLPGIGRYTAAAIASIAFGEPVAVVDGNVERVLQRVYGKRLSSPHAWAMAQSLCSKTSAGDYNQALMELGATVCLPRNPLCSQCPVRALCASRAALPAGRKAKPPKTREVACALVIRKDRVLLAQRAAHASLMAGMWELPSLHGRLSTAAAFTLRHSITTTNYTVRIVRNDAFAELPGKWIPLSRVTRLPLTGLARKALRRAGLIRT